MKKLIGEALLVIIGNAILAFGTTAFLVPAGIIAGGATGLSLAITHFITLPLSFVVFIINIIMLMIGFIFVGRKFMMGTIASTFLFPFFLALFERIPGIYSITNDMFLYVIYAGALIGLGCGIVLRLGYSTGGMDVIPVLINKKTGSSIALWMNITDTLILFSQIFISTPEEILYGIIVVFISSIVINEVMVVGEHNLQVIVISKETKTMAQRIDKEIERGCTFLNITTGYMRDNQKALLCVISPRQQAKLNDLIQSVDENAFIITSDVHNVWGRGFTLPNIDL